MCLIKCDKCKKIYSDHHLIELWLIASDLSVDIESSWSILFDSLYSCTDVVSRCMLCGTKFYFLWKVCGYKKLGGTRDKTFKHLYRTVSGHCLKAGCLCYSPISKYFMFYRKFNLVSALQMWWQNVGIKMRYDSVEICIWKPTLSSAILGNRFQFSNYQNLDWFQF